MESILLASFKQALLSALTSICLGIPLIFLLFQVRGSRQASLYEGFFSFCWICPVMPVVVGMIQIFETFQLFPYGLLPIVVVHAWLNAPLVALLGVRALHNVSAFDMRLAGVLGLTPIKRLGVLYARPLGVALIVSASLVFFLCITSFNVVLYLGRDYPWPSLGLALYSALFDAYLPDRAMELATLVMGLALLKTLTLGLGRRGSASLGASVGPCPSHLLWCVLLWGAVLVWCIPLFACVRFVDFWVLTHGQVWEALGTSVGLAVVCGLASVVCAFVIALWLARSASNTLYALLSFLALPSFLVGGALYVMLARILDVDAWSFPLMALTQVLVTLPWGVRTLLPRAQFIQRASGRLSHTLGLTWYARAVHVFAPPMKDTLLKAFSLCAVFSLGDAASVCLFDASHTTLVTLVGRQLETFDVAGAHTLSFLVGALALMFYVIPHLWRTRHADM
ncbi:MAG: hypothetical protein C0514_03450 [Candidatus Puniceispirillum sp.]|nr:hypothetical protein [Candidatus Puniceispirillum sp.]